MTKLARERKEKTDQSRTVYNRTSKNEKAKFLFDNQNRILLLCFSGDIRMNDDTDVGNQKEDDVTTPVVIFIILIIFFLVIAGTIFLIVKKRKQKNQDLVSKNMSDTLNVRSCLLQKSNRILIVST